MLSAAQTDASVGHQDLPHWPRASAQAINVSLSPESSLPSGIRASIPEGKPQEELFVVVFLSSSPSRFSLSESRRQLGAAERPLGSAVPTRGEYCRPTFTEAATQRGTCVTSFLLLFPFVCNAKKRVTEEELDPSFTLLPFRLLARASKEFHGFIPTMPGIPFMVVGFFESSERFSVLVCCSMRFMCMRMYHVWRSSWQSFCFEFAGVEGERILGLKCCVMLR